MPVSADDPRPPYLQVAEDLRAQIAAGTLAPGDKLPAGRELATQFGVALMTVQRAIGSLQEDGILVTRQGSGTFVASGDATARPTSSPEYAEISRQIGELRELVQETAKRLDERLTALEESAGLKPEPRSRRRSD